MTSPGLVVLPPQSSFAVYAIDKDYLIVNPSINFWFKLSKEQLLAFSLLDGKSNLNELLTKIAEEFPLSLQETCKMFLNNLASNFPTEPVEGSKPVKLSQLYLVLTNNCNSSCVYCFRNAGNSHVSMIDKKVAAEAIASYRKISIADASIVYTGGEPTCHPNLIELAERAREEGFRNTLQTNGLLITRNPGLYARVFDTIQISLDSANEETNDWLRGKRGHFRAVSETIALLKQYSATVRLSATITKKNLKDITRIREAFPGIQFQYTPMLRIGRGKSTANLSLSPTEFLKHLSETPECVNECALDIPNFGEKNIGCGAGSAILSVSPEGEVFPCQMLHHDTLRCGNLREHSLEEIYNTSVELWKFRQYSVDTIKNCRKCNIRYICGGGCIANGFWVRNRIFDRDRFCAYNRKLIFHNLNNQFKEVAL